MPFLVLESRGHQQREDLIEQRSSAERTGVIGYLTKGHFAHRWGAVLDLEHELHDAALVDFVLGQTLQTMRVRGAA